jgi:hypothetical protein
MEREFTKGGGAEGNEKASKKGSVITWQATCITVWKKKKKSKESEEQRAGRNSRETRVRAVETESPALQATTKSQYYVPWQLLQGSTASFATYTQET